MNINKACKLNVTINSISGIGKTEETVNVIVPEFVAIKILDSALSWKDNTKMEINDYDEFLKSKQTTDETEN